MPTKMNEEQSKLSRAPVLNFSFTVCGGSLTPALTARKLGMIHRIRLVCCASSAFAVLADADELGVDAALCSPALTADGTGASGIAATSPCGAAAVNSKPAFCCAIAGVKAKRNITQPIANRIKSPVLIRETPL